MKHSLMTLATATLGFTGFSLAHSYRGEEMKNLPDPATIVEVKLSKDDEDSNFGIAMAQDFFQNGTNLGKMGWQDLETAVEKFEGEKGIDLGDSSWISSGMIIDRSYNLYSFQLINPHFLVISDYHEHGGVPRMTTIFLEFPNIPLEVEGLLFEEFLKKQKAERPAQ